MINLIFPTFNPSQKNIDIHLENWSKYSQENLKLLNVIVIDDCSSVLFKFNNNIKMNFTLIRITTNCGYNIGGAKNLGMTYATKDWCICTDTDHIVTQENFIKCLNFNKDLNKIYFFNRLLNDETPRNKVHPSSFLIHNNTFWKMGGYDEEFSGCYGYEDALFIALMDKYYSRETFNDINIHEYKEFMTKGLQRDRNVIRNINGKLCENKIKLLKENKYKNGNLLRFDWEIIEKCSI